MIFFDAVVPWTAEGLKPYSSYSLAGGAGLQNVEFFISGWTQAAWIKDRCDGPLVICELLGEEEVAQKVADQIIAGGELETVLGPDNSLVNVGIEISDRLISFALQFEALRLIPVSTPAIRQRVLTLDAAFESSPPVVWDVADLYFDPPRKSLDPNLMAQSPDYCYGGGLSTQCHDPLSRIWPPPEPGFSYTDQPANVIVASRWDVGPSGFRLEAELGNQVTEAGFYTLVIWDAEGTTELLAYSFEYDPAIDPLPTPTPSPTPSPLGERSFADRPDDVDGPQVHFVYLLPSDTDDLEIDTNGSMRRSITAIQDWLSDESDGYSLRVDTFQGEIDVSFIRIDKTQFEVFNENPKPVTVVASELLARGFNKDERVYAVYYGGFSELGICGRGGTIGSGRIAVTHLGRNCPASLASHNAEPKFSDYTMIHEIMHSLGAVPSCAPNSDAHDGDLRGHVDDWDIDLMWGQGHSEDTRLSLDLGRDDYFDHDNEGCPDVADSPFLIPPAG